MRFKRMMVATALMIAIAGSPVMAQDAPHTVQYDKVRFSYPAWLATGLQIEPLEAIPFIEDMMFAETYPEHIRISLLGYMDGSAYQLPYPLQTPQIHLYPTAAIDTFGYAFAEESATLATLLHERPDLNVYVGASVTSANQHLPFLPWLNSAQILRSHARYLDNGIRYLTLYAQDADFISDRQLFYTFQGLTQSTDGDQYVAVMLPVKTGVLPEAIDTSDVDWDSFAVNYGEYLAATFEQISHMPDDAFNPPLHTLDALVQSIALAYP